MPPKRAASPPIRARESDEHQHHPAPHNDANSKAAPSAPIVRVKAPPSISSTVTQQSNTKPDDLASTTSTNLNTNQSPSIAINAPSGSAFPSNPSASSNGNTTTHNHHHHHSHVTVPDSESANVKTIHTVVLTRASPERATSPRHSNEAHVKGVSLGRGSSPHQSSSSHMGSKQNTTGSNISPTSTKQKNVSPQQQSGGGDHPKSASDTKREHFVQKASVKLADILAITKMPSSPTTNKSPTLRASDIKVPTAEVLLEIGREIADKLFDQGESYARSHYSDLSCALENETNEVLRNNIRNRKIDPEHVAALSLVDLLNKAEKAQLKSDAEEEFKNHNMKDITRAVAAVEKNVVCPSCGTKEAAILESNNVGGEPRFWSGTDSEQQQLTLFKCLNCDHEFSKQSKF